MKARAGVLLGSWVLMTAGTVSAGTGKGLTCDPERIDPRSYRLTTLGLAAAVTADRSSWWDHFDLRRYREDLEELNFDVTRIAERALRIDPANRMAHAVLARQYLIDGEPERAEEAWEAVLDSDGAVGWTGTLYDVDARTYFLLAFDRQGIRIYRFEQVAAPVKRGRGGIPEFPPPGHPTFWAAAGGCVDPTIVPEAEVPWSSVHEIKANNWMLWFKLRRPVAVSSDRNGKKRQLEEIKVNLHGRSGELEVYKPVGEDRLAMRGRGPAGFQDLVRRTLVKLVDPEKRISLPPVRPGLGW